MSKDAYYFSHDSNARHDRKIVALKHTYGLSGYGMWWVIVEILREQADYKLEYDEITFIMLADELGTSVEQAKDFVEDCINKYKLLVTDHEKFWSESLLKRMQRLNEIREKRKKAGIASAEKRKKASENQQ
jgi:hypothetical protein